MPIGDAVAEAIGMKYPSDLEEQGGGEISRYQEIAFGEEQADVSMADYWTVKIKMTKGRSTIEEISVKLDTSADLLLTREKGKVHKDQINLSRVLASWACNVLSATTAEDSRVLQNQLDHTQ
jgi:hypothetical protein